MNPKNRTPIIVGAVVVAILALAGIALALSGGDDDAANNVADSGSLSADPVPTYSDNAEAFRPVEVAGDPLPAYDPASDPSADSAVGMAAPVVTGSDFDGNAMTLGGETTNATMLVFLAHWCPHCNAEVPRILEVNNNGGIPANLDVIGISTGADETRPNSPPYEWIADMGWLWPTMADNEQQAAIQANGGTVYPFLVILDADGTVIARTSGELSVDDLTVWISDAMASIEATG